MDRIQHPKGDIIILAGHARSFQNRVVFLQKIRRRQYSNIGRSHHERQVLYCPGDLKIGEISVRNII